MGSTTLFTFLFEHPTRAQTVELLGSWDNFTKPYHLQRDRRRGRGVWSGCYTFDNIICDGDLEELGERRSGALKMGGTYWYYYNVDGEECHNASEPSTTTCPLLPGQTLNVLEVPQESKSRDSPGHSDVFTRNPQDKFLTSVPPTPPKALPFPRVADFCKETYTVPAGSVTGPRSATSPTRAASRSIRGLEIGAPTLISSTAEDVYLVPLSSLQRSPVSSPSTASQISSSLPPYVRAKLREFSPLGSHPVDPAKDLDSPSLSTVLADEDFPTGRLRSQSDAAPTSTGSLCAPASTERANSADTKRTKVFCNEPWISSPRLPRQLEIDTEEAAENLAAAPVLQRPSTSLEPPSTDARPTSSHGGGGNSSLRDSVLDKNKDLPPLPRYLVPAPLYACNSASSSPRLHSEPDVYDHEEAEEEDENSQLHSQRKAHLATWSTESVAFSVPTSDEEDVYSPTFSSLASNCSDTGSPQRYSRFSISDYIHSPDRNSAVIEEEIEDQEKQDDSIAQHSIPASPPKLGELHLSAFGPSLFNLDFDIQCTESEPHRQATCFGVGFEGYKLPEDEPESKVTITESSLHPHPAIYTT